VHTWVPDTLRGQGVADALMQSCARWCEQQHYQLVATCSYAVRWLERKGIRHPGMHYVDQGFLQ
jgi:predicted GNAT family acetyltransferase